MFVLITVEALYYGGALRTYATHAEAFKVGVSEGAWFDIERII